MSFNVSPNLFWFINRTPAAGIPDPWGPSTDKDIIVEVYPEWYKNIRVQWTVPSTWGACKFNVYFSQVEHSDYVKINEDPIDGTYLHDTTTREYSKFRHGFYVVEAILLEHNSVVVKSLPSTWRNKQRRWVELRSVEVQRREHWLLTKFAGVRSYLFKRKSYGKRCPHCWNEQVEAVLRDHCEVCYGVSFEGGYFEPVEVWLQYDATPVVKTNTYFGDNEPAQLNAWTISYPEIRPEDIIVRTGDWGVYTVQTIQTTELQANPVRQIASLIKMPKKDIEYKLIKKLIPEPNTL